MSLPANISQIVKQKLRWSDMDYNVFQYEQGMAYLKYYLSGDTDSIERLETCRFFWVWWVKRWTDRDLEFVNFCKNISSSEWESLYQNVHDPALLSNRIYPNKIIWKQALKETV